MRVQTRDADLGLRDTKLSAGIVRQTDALQHTRFFDAVTGLPQGDMCRNMYNPQILMRQHHRIVLGMRVIRVDLRMSGIMMARQVDGFLVERVRDGRVDLSLHGQLNDLDHIGKSRLARHRGHLAALEAHDIDLLHVVYIDRARRKERLAHVRDRVDPDLSPHSDIVKCHIHHGRVPDHDRAAGLINGWIRQGENRNLRPDACRIAHRNPYLILHGLYTPRNRCRRIPGSLP